MKTVLFQSELESVFSRFSGLLARLQKLQYNTNQIYNVHKVIPKCQSDSDFLPRLVSFALHFSCPSSRVECFSALSSATLFFHPQTSPPPTLLIAQLCLSTVSSYRLSVSLPSCLFPSLRCQTAFTVLPSLSLCLCSLYVCLFPVCFRL